ncbi:89_t:CDS:2 [Diversispora eburnea]|uniref:89_t:CDS:1 n=1 Tax=Diversispora eburnea TaxID=1213867 RepID=A0A9N8Z0U1_9GLOM|nr:89_t:CDS:2 [Diversispora eburnea]
MFAKNTPINLLNPSVPEISNPPPPETFDPRNTESFCAQSTDGWFPEMPNPIHLRRLSRSDGPGLQQMKVPWNLTTSIGQRVEDLENEMPGAIYLPVDKKRREDLLDAAPARRTHDLNLMQLESKLKKLGTNKSVIIDYNFRKQGWNPSSRKARGYGAPSRIFIASVPFEVAIGDNNNWSKWVKTDTLKIWQRNPGDHINSSLVGCDVLDQFFFARQPNQRYQFLRATYEVSLN